MEPTGQVACGTLDDEHKAARRACDEAKIGGTSACPHVASFVNRGRVLTSPFPDVDAMKECSSCGKGFLNWVCLGCLKVFCSRATQRWHHKCGYGGDVTCLTVDMAAVTVKCTPCGRSLDLEEICSHANLRSVMEQIHKAKFGHTLLLTPPSEKAASQASLQSSVQGVLGASQSIEDKWKAFQDQFQAILDQSMEQIAAAFGAETSMPTPVRYVPTEKERAKCFGDATPSIAAFATALKSGRFSKIMVVAGAGMSCASGLPDFRTPGTGLYSQLEEYHLPSPHSMFDIDFFKKNPKPFHVFAKELYPGRYAPSRAHYFLRLLELKGVLQRVYTQNVDGLEELAGVTSDKVIQCHGGFKEAQCVECKALVNPDEVKEAIFADEIAHCPECGGLAKPAIVFFGEGLGGRFHTHRMDDLDACGAMLVIGTSLSVAPTASLPKSVGKDVPRLLVNREPVGDFHFDDLNYRDVPVLGDCDDGVNRLADALGWRKELDDLVKRGRTAHPEAFARSEEAVREMAAMAKRKGVEELVSPS